MFEPSDEAVQADCLFSLGLLGVITLVIVGVGSFRHQESPPRSEQEGTILSASADNSEDGRVHYFVDREVVINAPGDSEGQTLDLDYDSELRLFIAQIAYFDSGSAPWIIEHIRGHANQIRGPPPVVVHGRNPALRVTGPSCGAVQSLLIRTGPIRDQIPNVIRPPPPQIQVPRLMVVR